MAESNHRGATPSSPEHRSAPSQAPPEEHPERVQRLLEGLNEPQREAVTHGEGPLLILAGAGSGKTRVLTHRVAFLIFTGQAHPSEILAITFTNKAAQEMRGRVERLLMARPPAHTRGMWLMTFHAACARILRAQGERLGYTSRFTIYDQADARRMVKRCIEEVGVDPKRFAPAAVHSQISQAKNKLLSASDCAQAVGSQFEEVVAEVYGLYESELLRMNAMDFDDLLFRTVNLLELFEEVRTRYAQSFKHVLVDEYQDTNHAQYRFLQLLVGGGRAEPTRGERVNIPGHRNLAVVGDDSQCLVAGTAVTMGDGRGKLIEDVRVGEEVLSCYGSGDFRPARVIRIHRSNVAEGVAITLRSGRRIVSTPEHTHFAGYRVGSTPQMHMTYLMRHREKGYRVGTSRIYTAGQVKPVVGVSLRTRQESADAVWVVGTHPCEAEARVHEMFLSLRYRLPTIPFRARRNGSNNGLICNQGLIDSVFRAFDTVASGAKLLADEGFDPGRPHFVPRSYEGRRRVVTVTLCADRRGRTPMHLVAMGGRDTGTRKVLEQIGLSVRPAKAGSQSWRYESVYKDFAAVMDIVARIQSAVPVPVSVRCQARLGLQSESIEGNSLPFIPAASVRPGMVMFTEVGDYDVVENVERVSLNRPVFDLDVEGTHNFIAEGLITHNSIYGFRGADVRNILDFTDDFPDARVVKLEQNYRSTQTILSAANAVIANNRGGIAKRLWSEKGQGSPIRVHGLDDEHVEARFVVGELERLVDEGASRAEIAVFYRTNAMSRVIEDTLVRRELAYQVIGGTKFYERAEIKDAVAYLAWIANPFDVVSFQRVANSPRRGLGQTSLSRIVAHSASVGESVWEVAAAADRIPGLGAAAIKALSRFMGTMEDLAGLARDGIPVGDLMDAVLARAGYVEALEAEAVGRGEKAFESQGRIENLQQLVEVAHEFDANASAEGDTLELFLQELALKSDGDSRRDDEGLITLMTLHNAKGLEYPIVFVVGCEDGVFPHQRALDEGGVEEERRLFYVAVTRAMRELYLTYARRRSVFGAPTYGISSRFLDEIPAELTERDELPAPRPGGARVGVGAGANGFSSGGGSGWSAGSHSSTPAVSYRLGEDVVHAAFGEGVVTGVEPGGIIVVRFAGDGSERKLMADYAPVSRR
jgi:DNA helicase-2/ATP-dependent DNA helicase PcrA